MTELAPTRSLLWQTSVLIQSTSFFREGCGSECHSHDNVAVDSQRSDELPRRRGTGLFAAKWLLLLRGLCGRRIRYPCEVRRSGRSFDCSQKRRVIAQDASQHQRPLDLMIASSALARAGLGHAAFLGDIREGFQPSLKCELQSSCEFFGPTGDRQNIRYTRSRSFVIERPQFRRDHRDAPMWRSLCLKRSKHICIEPVVDTSQQPL